MAPPAAPTSGADPPGDCTTVDRAGNQFWRHGSMMHIVFYDRVPWWIVDFVILVLLLTAGEVGFRWGRRSQSKVDERTESKMTVVEGGLMGILGLLLAFTMSMAVSRFESR